MGCGPAVPDPEPEPAPVPVAPPAERKITTIVGDGDAVSVTLRFRGVGPLYQGYFTTADFVGKLGTALGACQEDEAVVLITYDSDQWIGTITLETTPEIFACVATTGADGLDLSPMQPVGVALAHYRDQVSSTYDIRVASFRVGVSLLKGTNLCTFWIGGQYPPNGTTWNLCPSFTGNETCAKGKGDEGVTVLDFANSQNKRSAETCFGY